MNFSEKTLDEIGTIVTGKTPPTSQTDMFGGLYPFITPTDIDGQSRLVKTERFLSEKWFNKQKNYLLPKNTICYVCIGNTIGKTCMTDKLSFSNQQINSVITNENNNPFYIYYLLNFNKNEIRTIAGGAATPIINKSIFSGFKVKVTSLKNQQKIASILSAYDDLIENNNKRIKILEEITQSIYKEWFVDFKFPGHEKVKMVNSEFGKIPEGWYIEKISEVTDVKWGDTSLTKSSYTKSGYLAYSASGPDGLLNHFDFDRKGVVLSAIGANCGLTWFAKNKWSCIKNTIRFWSLDENKISTEYLYFVTKTPGFWLRRGAAQPFISQRDILNSKITIPSKEVNILFAKASSEIIDEISILKKKNELLNQVKNTLLPKLISGELDVEGLDIKIRPEIL